MTNKIWITLAMVTAVTVYSSVAATARGGGGHGVGGHGVGGHGGGPGGFTGNGGFAGGMGVRGYFAPEQAGGSHSVAGRPLSLRGDRFAFARSPFRDRFSLFGAPYPYYSDVCYSRVWTRWGWRWSDVCW